MPILNCYVDEETMKLLKEFSDKHERTVEELAEVAIAEYTLECWKKNQP